MKHQQKEANKGSGPISVVVNNTTDVNNSNTNNISGPNINMSQGGAQANAAAPAPTPVGMPMSGGGGSSGNLDPVMEADEIRRPAET